jgi:lipid II:glycine glycyltransferase (peptidoglycan interpeptide bridge formation enzyme)
MQDFYGLLLKSGQRQGFPVRSLDYFLQIQRTLLAEGNGLVFLAGHEQETIAGALCSRFGTRCHYLYGGFDWDYRRLGANEPLQWRAIQWAKDAGCRWYDTGGLGTSYPPREGNSGYGVYNYKKGFGADICYSAGLFDLVNSRAGYAAFRLFEKRLLPRAYKLAGGFLSRARHFYAARSSWKITRRLEKPA